MKTVTIVVPIYNEADNISHFTNAIHKVMKNLPYNYQLLFVNDGSTDNSLAILQQLTLHDHRLRYISLARNFGHQLALTCGLDNANGDAIITMDGDMQHPPTLLPTLLQKWEAGYDIVQTIRQTTVGVSAFKRLTSKYYYRALNLVSTVPIQPGGSDFRLLDRKAADALKNYREHDRFIRGLVGGMGFKTATITFTAPARFAGKSKFSLRKMLKFAVDGILGNTIIPLRMAFYLGVTCALLSLILLAHGVLASLLGNAVAGWSTLICCLAFFGGVQLMVLGVIGEYIGRIFREVKNRPLYLIDTDSKQNNTAITSPLHYHPQHSLVG